MERLRRALTASLLLFLLSGHLVAQQPPETFEGEIEVREIGVIVEPPEEGSLRSVRPEDILVFEDGAPRQVVKAEPLRPESGSWRLVLYIDRELARPQTVHDAALVLSRQARRLTDLGAVEIVVANPDPDVRLTSTRDARSLSNVLGEIAAQARKEVRPSRTETSAAAPSPDLLQRQLGRLSGFLGARPGAAGARALFLVADGFVPPPGETAFLNKAEDPGAQVPPGTLAAALRDSSRLLAADGWITFAGPLRDSSSERERRQMGDMERIRVQAGGSKHTAGTPPVIQMPPADRGARGDERVADVFSRPDFAAWKALSQPTSGTVMGVEAQLASLIDGLSRRWRIWYRAPEAADGKLRALEVRLPSAGEPLRGPHWVRSPA